MKHNLNFRRIYQFLLTLFSLAYLLILLCDIFRKTAKKTIADHVYRLQLTHSLPYLCMIVCVYLNSLDFMRVHSHTGFAFGLSAHFRFHSTVIFKPYVCFWVSLTTLYIKIYIYTYTYIYLLAKILNLNLLLL